MRTCILLSLACLALGCSKEKKAEHTSNCWLGAYKTSIISSANDTSYKYRMYVSFGNKSGIDNYEAVDVGPVSYADIALKMDQAGYYSWTDSLLPFPDIGVWYVPGSKTYPLAMYYDTLGFPKLINFPDTLQKSGQFTISSDDAVEMKIHVSSGESYSFNNTLAHTIKEGNTITLEASDEQLVKLPDSVFITISASRWHSITDNEQVVFDRNCSWSKWVKVVE